MMMPEAAHCSRPTLRDREQGLAMHRTRVSYWTLTLGLLTILATGLPGCGTTRPPQEQGYLLEQRRADSEHYLSQTQERYLALLQGLKAQYDAYSAGRQPRAPVLDYLIISGGGDWGAFGASILKGWGKVPPSEPLARPRFDIVTGVSTGALIAPFAYLGDDDSIERIVTLYRNPQSDWVKTRWPLYFLPNNISFAEVPGLEREVKKTVTPEMIARIADAGKDGRLLFVNTTNLDDASPHVFYLIPEARRAVETGDVERFHRILLASSGIPGAFPYRVIDGAMYVDGGVSSNMIFGSRIPEEHRLPALWQSLYPDVPMPKLRYWVIFNNQFQSSPTVVKARWFDIISRSIELSTRSATLASMRQLHLMAEVARLKRHADIEVRIVAVPDDWMPPKPGTFVKETMNNLADLGERMGADPTSWRTSPP
jgi:predicted acylesterase/phospholipase RssA